MSDQWQWERSGHLAASSAPRGAIAKPALVSRYPSSDLEQTAGLLYYPLFSLRLVKQHNIFYCLQKSCCLWINHIVIISSWRFIKIKTNLTYGISCDVSIGAVYFSTGSVQWRCSDSALTPGDSELISVKLH